MSSAEEEEAVNSNSTDDIDEVTSKTSKMELRADVDDSNSIADAAVSSPPLPSTLSPTLTPGSSTEEEKPREVSRHGT